MVSKIAPWILRWGLFSLVFIVCAQVLPSPLMRSSALEDEILSSLAVGDEVLAETVRAGRHELRRALLPLPLFDHDPVPALRLSAVSVLSTLPEFHHSPVRRVHQLVSVYRI